MTRYLHITVEVPPDDLYDKYGDDRAHDLAWQHLTSWGEYSPPEFTATWGETDELERLRAWKAEALLVLGQWEAVWETAGRPGPLGFSKPAAVQALIADLMEQHDWEME